MSAQFDANVDSREGYSADEIEVYEALADLVAVETVDSIEDGDCDVNSDWIDPSGSYEYDENDRDDEDFYANDSGWCEEGFFEYHPE